MYPEKHNLRSFFQLMLHYFVAVFFCYFVNPKLDIYIYIYSCIDQIMPYRNDGLQAMERLLFSCILYVNCALLCWLAFDEPHCCLVHFVEYLFLLLKFLLSEVLPVPPLVRSFLLAPVQNVASVAVLNTSFTMLRNTFCYASKVRILIHTVYLLL